MKKYQLIKPYIKKVPFTKEKAYNRQWNWFLIIHVTIIQINKINIFFFNFVTVIIIIIIINFLYEFYNKNKQVNK